MAKRKNQSTRERLDTPASSHFHQGALEGPVLGDGQRREVARGRSAHH